MMQFLYEYGLFFAKTATFVIAIFMILGMVVAAKSRDQKPQGILRVEDISAKLKEQVETVSEIFEQEEKPSCWSRWFGKKYTTETNDSETQTDKAESKTEVKKSSSRLYVIDFNGDEMANQVDSLREEISALCQVCQPGDEILLRLESPGGAVHGYGLAAAQLERIRQLPEVKFTIAVDKVAASGGYMMACVGEQILAAPFAIVGSIGVVAQLPNLHRWLDRQQIDYEQFTAGKYKRTVTMLGENTTEGRAKFQQELEEVHHYFQSFVLRYRPSINADQIATGEHWLAVAALELGLVDRLLTSDAYLLERQQDHVQMISIKYEMKPKLLNKFSELFESLLAQISQLRSNSITLK